MSVVLAAAPTQGIPPHSSPAKYYTSGTSAISASDANSIKLQASFAPVRADSNIFTGISGTSTSSSRSSSTASNASVDSGNDLKSESPSPVRLLENFHGGVKGMGVVFHNHNHNLHHQQQQQQLQQQQHHINVPTSGVKRKASDSSDTSSSGYSNHTSHTNHPNHYSQQLDNHNHNHFLGASKRGRLDSENTSFGSDSSPQQQRMPSAFGLLEGSEVTSVHILYI
ncbi:hypothetical protein EGW08_013268 [Elysia chlorotica]|uniref:Uncharacterized protein n=1 Tax=Elysia chlorotica TaxID=188477 RepID=A0A3S1BEJ3_ELYCH|nr:hypothetical protein EGW08_013268 [Elysia chlorotica]